MLSPIINNLISLCSILLFFCVFLVFCISHYFMSLFLSFHFTNQLGEHRHFIFFPFNKVTAVLLPFLLLVLIKQDKIQKKNICECSLYFCEFNGSLLLAVSALNDFQRFNIKAMRSSHLFYFFSVFRNCDTLVLFYKSAMS